MRRQVRSGRADGRPVRVCSLAHLIRTKRLDGRASDARDIEAFLAVEHARIVR